MKKSYLSSLMALSLSLEMILAPLPALANDDQNKSKITGQNLMEGLNYGMGLYNQVRGGAPAGGAGGQMPPQMASDMAEFQKQVAPRKDKFFTYENMQKIPGLIEYIAVYNNEQLKKGGKVINPAQLDCKTLPTTLHEAKNEVCRDGSGTGNPVMDKQNAFLYYNQYLQIEKTYKNYTEQTNTEGQAFGVGCMKDAMQLLKGFFDYRTTQLDAVMGEMEKALAAFDEQSKAELTNIKRSSAVLNGEGSAFAEEFKNTDAFNYAARFGDPACSSIFPKDGEKGVSSLGKDKGLLGIEEQLKTDFSAVPEGSNYSPEQFVSKNAEILSDITKMADKVSEQAQLNFSAIANDQNGYSAFLDQVGRDVSSDSGANKALNKSFFADLQTKFTKSRNQLNDEMDLVSSELGVGKDSEAFSQLSKIDSDSSFEAEVSTIENNMKAACVNDTGIDTALSRIYDPNLSAQANKQTSEQMRRKLRVILSDLSLTPAQKMERLTKLDQESKNRYVMKLDADYEIQQVTPDNKVLKKKVSAAGRVTPSGYFTDVINNCESQFQVNKLKNKLTGKDAIKRLRTLKQEFKKTARQHSQDIRNEIVKKMIDCGGNGAKAAGAGVGVCGPAALNMQSPGFCAKAAFACSSNMKSCNEKAKKFVKEIKDERLKLTQNYNNNVDLHRKQLVASFDTALRKYTADGESLRAQFGEGFTVPTDIQRDLQGDAQFNPDLKGDAGDPLQIKDPKAYLDMVKANMEKLKKNVDDQQKLIAGDSGLLAKHIELTKNNYEENVINVAAGLKDACLSAYNKIKGDMAAQQTAYNDAQGQMGEKNGELCSKYDQIMSNNPNGACDSFEQTGTDALKAAAKAGGSTTTINTMIAEMRERCAGAGLDDAYDICETELGGKGDLKDMCKALSDPNATTEKKKHCDVSPEKEVNYSDCQEKGKSYDDNNAKLKCASGERFLRKVTGTSCTIGTSSGDPYIVYCAAPATYDCANLEKKIKSAYKSARTASFASSTQSNPVPGSCPANNNSGQFNTKSMFPDGSNPLVPQSGAAGQQH
jgi:hypothetical protein